MKSNDSTRHVVSCVAALILALCTLGPGAAACARKPVIHTVIIDASRFEPAALRVMTGDTIVWINMNVSSAEGVERLSQRQLRVRSSDKR
jgi:plastocyanin